MMAMSMKVSRVLVVCLVFTQLIVDRGYNYSCSATADSSVVKKLHDGQAGSKVFDRQHQINSVPLKEISEPVSSTMAMAKHQGNVQTVKSLPKWNTTRHHPKPKGSRQIHKTKQAKLAHGKTRASKIQENKAGYFVNHLKTSFNQRRKRESTSQPSCRFPSFLETSTLCAVSKLTPGKVCKWIHTRQGRTPLFPFPNPVQSYHDWELQISGERIRNENTRYLFECANQYRNGHYLVKITGKVEDVSGRYYQNTRFLCLKFIPRGLNVVQYMASKSSNVSEDLNCETQKLKYIEQVLIADKFRELPDCPPDLRGAFKITRIHDAVHNVTCRLEPLKTSLLESDCVNKEGMHLDFSAFRDCSGFNNGTSGVMYTRDILYLRCYSTSWENDGWNYVVVKRDKTTRKVGYRNTKMFYCLRFKKDPVTANIKFYIYFDSMCLFDDSLLKNSTSYFALDLVPLTSSLMTDAKKAELGILKCDFPEAIQGQWSENTAYSSKQTIKIGKQNIGFGKDGEYKCMQSDGGEGIEQLFPMSTCVKDVWMERRKIPHFNYSFVLISDDLPVGCRPRFVGFSVLQDKALTYRLSQSIALPMDFVQQPMLFVLNSLPEKFCSDRNLYRLDPYPHWGRNIEKIAIRSNALESNQPLVDCRLHGPLPNMFTGYLRVNIFDGGVRNTKCPGRIDVCLSPTKIHLQYDKVSCGKEESSYGCLGRVWDAKQDPRYDHYLLQDLLTHQIYCARSSYSSFEIVRSASMQCYEFYWGLAAFQNHFHEKIDILTEGFMECPTGLPATDGASPTGRPESGVTSVVFEDDASHANTSVLRRNNTKTKAVSAAPISAYTANILLFAFCVCIWLGCAQIFLCV